MGHINLRIKIMPVGVSTDLMKIEDSVKKTVEKEGGKGCMFVQEPIAFGLKAVIVTFIYPEEKEIDPLEENLRKIKDVNSVQIIDMRRAL